MAASVFDADDHCPQREGRISDATTSAPEIQLSMSQLGGAMTWKTIFATGAFGGIAPILLQLAIDLTQGRKRVEAIGLSILIGMAIYAVLGGGLSLIWKETDLKKVFYIGLGLPSLLTIASANITAPQQPSNPVSSPAISVPQQAPRQSSGSPSAEVHAHETSGEMTWRVYAQTNVPDRQLIVDFVSQSVPKEVTQAPLYIIFEPTGTNAPVQYGQALVDVPQTATSFRVEGTMASSDSIDLPKTAGSTTRVRFKAENRSWYGLLYSLGARVPPYQLIKSSIESTVPVTDPKDSIVGQIQLMATSKPIETNQGGNRYAFSLSIDVPNALKGNIARVEYDLVYEPNSLWLTSNDPSTNFEVAYNGWGCYRNVEATVIFKNVDTQPRKKHFNMCTVLGT